MHLSNLLLVTTIILSISNNINASTNIDFHPRLLKRGNFELLFLAKRQATTRATTANLSARQNRRQRNRNKQQNINKQNNANADEANNNVDGSGNVVDPNDGALPNTNKKNDGTAENDDDLNGNKVGNLNGGTFCDAKLPGGKICDGSQLKDGSRCCSVTSQGVLQGSDKMVSSLILTPGNGETVNRDQDFTITVASAGMQLGFFSDANAQYYIQGQTLNSQGQIQGHQHVTVQQMLGPQSPMDPKSFDFFKGRNTNTTSLFNLLGLNDETGNNELSVVVPGGSLKTDGEYRLCTLAGSGTHQPVIMPVAQRGAQDDCIRFTATSGGVNVAAASRQAEPDNQNDAGDANNAKEVRISNKKKEAARAVAANNRNDGGDANNTREVQAAKDKKKYKKKKAASKVRAKKQLAVAASNRNDGEDANNTREVLAAKGKKKKAASKVRAKKQRAVAANNGEGQTKRNAGQAKGNQKTGRNRD